MIFVTVGTHEQPFNRLIQKVDELKRDGIIQEENTPQEIFNNPQSPRLQDFLSKVL